MSLSRAVNISDLRKLARARLPNAIFDYLDGGAEDELTLKENERVFSDYIFRPRHAVHVPKPDLSVTVMGQKLTMPAFVAPIGYSRLIHPKGEMGAVRAAGRRGLAFAMSTISGYALEEIASAATAPVFLQIYLLAGRAAGEKTLDRAQAAGYKGLFLTVDTPVAGMRERDFRNGTRELMGPSLAAKLRYLPDVLAHPGWLMGYLSGGKMKTLPNVVMPDGAHFPLTDVAKALETSVVTWDDLKWIRAQWKGPIAIKGVLTGDDALRARDLGATAVVVSNHGGRQLDPVASGMAALPEVVAAVGNDMEVIMDGGIRRGADIVKALALGAKAVMLGRGYAYGMAAAGEKGIDRALEIFHADMVRTMRLLGCKSVAELDGSYIQKRT
jgi:isopentenyl diphosphate isomerase/L-lactate dehydrogenase-like FMN-dependent dehydrogenase